MCREIMDFFTHKLALVLISASTLVAALLRVKKSADQRYEYRQIFGFAPETIAEGFKRDPADLANWLMLIVTAVACLLSLS